MSTPRFENQIQTWGSASKRSKTRLIKNKIIKTCTPGQTSLAHKAYAVSWDINVLVSTFARRSFYKFYCYLQVTTTTSSHPSPETTLTWEQSILSTWTTLYIIWVSCTITRQLRWVHKISRQDLLYLSVKCIGLGTGVRVCLASAPNLNKSMENLQWAIPGKKNLHSMHEKIACCNRLFARPCQPTLSIIKAKWN